MSQLSTLLIGPPFFLEKAVICMKGHERGKRGEESVIGDTDTHPLLRCEWITYDDDEMIVSFTHLAKDNSNEQ